MKTPKLPEEEQVLLRTAQGDQQAFTELYDHYHQKVYSVALHMLKSTEQAEEVVQEVFMKVWKKRKGLPQVRKFVDYLFIITRNQVITRFRELTVQAKAQEAFSEESGTVSNTDRPVIEAQYQELLRQALALLPPQQKQVYHLAREEGKSHQEIAEVMNISRLTVKKHMAVALKFIRERLGRDIEFGG